MKTEKININSMKLEKIRDILKTLIPIEDCEKLKEMIEIYATGEAKYPIKKIPKEIAKKHYFYFYEITGKDKNYREIPGENLGKLSKDLYEENKGKIEVLRLLGLKSELKELIENLTKINGDDK